MLLEDVLKEFIFDCKLRKLSERTSLPEKALKGIERRDMKWNTFTVIHPSLY